MSTIRLGVIQISDWQLGDRLYPAYYDEDKELAATKENIGHDDVVLKPKTKYFIEITYPLSKPCLAQFTTGKSGLTRGKLADRICKLYRKVYSTEDDTTDTPPGMVPGMLNRNKTSGKYGIWGHCIEDLCLCSANIDGKNKIQPGVDS